MSITAKALACADASGTHIETTIQRRAVGPQDVHIKIEYAGICHSDIHTGKGEWGEKSYPLATGHEIIGKVVAIGSDVTEFKIGDKAGVGCFVDSCGACGDCKKNDNQYCAGTGPNGKGMIGTYGKPVPLSFEPSGQTHGGYTSDIVVKEDHVLHVPDNIYSPAAAPLLCAGITCYSPFRHYGLKAGDQLGVVGLGGLGHMAVKIAAAMGAIVTVISRSPSKRKTALAMGAHKFVISTDKDDMKAAARSLDMIYNSIAFNHELAPYLDLLRTSGTMIMVGGIPENLKVSGFNLLVRRLRLAGSMIGGIKETQEMLDFCGKHNITATSEVIESTADAVNDAWDRAIRADVKYRFVIDHTGESAELQEQLMLNSRKKRKVSQ